MEKCVPAERFNGVKTNGRPWPQEKLFFLPHMLRFTPPNPTHIREPLDVGVGGNILARRNTAASKKAAEFSAGFAAREEELQNLATEFFDLENKSEYGKIQKRLEECQRRLKDLKSQLKEAEAELQAQQSPIIFAMKQVGETPTNIARRLGVRGVVVKWALRAEKEKQIVAGEDESVSSEDTHHELVDTNTYSNDKERNYHESTGE